MQRCKQYPRFVPVTSRGFVHLASDLPFQSDLPPRQGVRLPQVQDSPPPVAPPMTRCNRANQLENKKMRRYIVLQYMHGQRSDDPLSVTGTFDDLRSAQTFVQERLRDFNEIVDCDIWEVVWRLNKSGGRTPPLQ